jgi:hypothetical protein
MTIDIRRLYDEARAAQRALSCADHLLMPLTEVLALLPGVQTAKARAYLRWQCDLVLEQVIALDGTGGVAAVEAAPGIIITSAVCEDLFFGEDIGRQRVTPRGATLLLTLYERGVLPCRGKPGEPNPKLRAYAACEETLLATAHEYRARRDAERQRRKSLIEDPSQVTESEFEYGLLNDIFFAKLGPIRGIRTLAIGGIEVTKQVGVFKSNSGKSQDSEVAFAWVGSDGVRRVVDKPSSFASNRRNDAERNWGLPE